MSSTAATAPQSPPPAAAPTNGKPGCAATAARAALPPLLGVGLALFLHFVVGPAVGPFYGKLMLAIGINIIMAVSLNIVNGFTGQFSLGHAGFMAIGGYTAAVITYYGSMKLWGSPAPVVGFAYGGEWLLVGACLIGGLTAAVAGFLVGAPSLRLRGDYLAIVTLGFGEILRVVIQLSQPVIYSAKTVAETPWPELFTRLGGSLGFGGLPAYFANYDRELGFVPTRTADFWVYFFMAMTVIAAYRLKVSSFGRAFLSVREDETAAAALGVPVFAYKVRAFVIAAFFAGIGGALYAHQLGTTLKSDEMSYMRSVEFVIMVVLGGMGSISGAIIAAILLTVLPELLRDFQAYRMILYALALILIMILRPQGIMGVREIWEIKWVRRLLPRKEAA